MIQVIAVALAFSSAQAEDASATDHLDTFARQRDAIQTLQARFIQRTVTPDEVIESTGTVVYTNPKRIIFRYDDPDMDYMIDAHHAYEYDAELEQILIYDIAGRPEAEAFFMGFENNTDDLLQAYDVKPLPARNPETHAFALELIPKPTETDDALFQRVLLQIRRDDHLPSIIDIVNDAESSVTFNVSEFIVNETLTRDATHLVVPEGTDVIINDELADPVGENGAYYPLPQTTDSVLPEHAELEPVTEAAPLEPVDTTP